MDNLGKYLLWMGLGAGAYWLYQKNKQESATQNPEDLEEEILTNRLRELENEEREQALSRHISMHNLGSGRGLF